MSQEEKIEMIQMLMNQSGNTTKLVRYFVLQAIPNLPITKLDEIIAILTEE